MVAAVLLILFVGGFGIGSYSLRKTVSIEEEIIRNFGLYENKKIYEQIENIEFLKKLDTPDLFGQDPSGL